MSAVSRLQACAGIKPAADDELHVFGSLGILVDRDQRLRGVVALNESGVMVSIVAPPKRRGRRGWRPDGHRPRECGRCSLPGHQVQTCEVQGVAGPTSLMRNRRIRELRAARKGASCSPTR